MNANLEELIELDGKNARELEKLKQKIAEIRKNRDRKVRDLKKRHEKKVVELEKILEDRISTEKEKAEKLIKELKDHVDFYRWEKEEIDTAFNGIIGETPESVSTSSEEIDSDENTEGEKDDFSEGIDDVIDELRIVRVNLSNGESWKREYRTAVKRMNDIVNQWFKHLIEDSPVQSSHAIEKIYEHQQRIDFIKKSNSAAVREEISEIISKIVDVIKKLKDFK